MLGLLHDTISFGCGIVPGCFFISWLGVVLASGDGNLLVNIGALIGLDGANNGAEIAVGRSSTKHLLLEMMHVVNVDQACDLLFELLVGELLLSDSQGLGRSDAGNSLFLPHNPIHQMLHISADHLDV